MKKALIISGQITGQWEKMWAKAFEQLGFEIKYIGIFDKYDKIITKKLGTISYYMGPHFIGKKVRELYLKNLNKKLKNILESDKYDFILIYNGWDIILSDVWNLIKEAGRKVIILLADNPFFDTAVKKNNIFINYIKQADIILTADEFCFDCFQYFNNIKTILIPAGTDDNMFFPKAPNNSQLKEFGCDILFVGTGYGENNLGYFRGNILNEICEFDLKIFGDKNWKYLFDNFPNLKGKVIFKNLTTEEINTAYNCSKIFVALTNPLAVNAVHTRVYDALCSGTFVIFEDRKICKSLFPNNLVPTFKNIKELKDKIKYYLLNEKERKEIALEARRYVLKNYLVKDILKDILDRNNYF